MGQTQRMDSANLEPRGEFSRLDVVLGIGDTGIEAQ